MISVFNGRERSLGGAMEETVFVQINARFRECLHLLKGPRLAVFMAIALHIDKEGLAWPSYDTISRETGYGKHAVARALRALCEITIEGHRILLRVRGKRGEGGIFSHNIYLLFPSADEVREPTVCPRTACG